MNRVAQRSRRIVSIVGTRPEAIKMAPVARALASRPRLEHRVVLTGQHPNLAPFFSACAPGTVEELRFNPASRTQAQMRHALQRLLCGALAGTPPALVLVHGDTTSAMAGAFAARACGIAIGHVEAGLRSFLTDSGGLQEEGAALGKPVLVLRDVTEQPEALGSNNLLLVGTAEDGIVRAVTRLLDEPSLYERMSRPSLAYGDGKAALRIAEAIEAWLEPSRLRA